MIRFARTDSAKGLVPVGLWIALFFLAPVGGLAASALDQSSGAAISVGTCTSQSGTLLRRAAQAKPWEAVPTRSSISTAEGLLALPGDKATVSIQEGPLSVTLWGNVPALSSNPVLESALSFLSEKGGDTHLALDRGRIALAHTDSKGEHAVQVHFQDKVWRVALEPGAQAALELYSRWAPGTFRRNPGPDDVPTVAVVLWMLKGQGTLTVNGESYRLAAPPGPAYYHWHSVTGRDPSPQRRDHLPSWASGGTLEGEAGAVEAAVTRRRQRLASGAVEAVLREQAAGSDSLERRLAIFGLGAIDDLSHLFDALESKQPDGRDAAIRALRHWIGRGVREDQELYHYLQRERGYSASQSEILMQLLHGLSEEQERSLPETYETLIAYLRHDKVAIRALAHWQLLHWVPSGKNIPYDAAASEQERERGYQEWKKLVPTGKLPPHPTVIRRHD